VNKKNKNREIKLAIQACMGVSTLLLASVDSNNASQNK
jgi:hypothetical protein